MQNELLEKLKLDAEREKRKLEREAKRRAELEKIKKESLVIQANLLPPLKKESQPVQPNKAAMKSQPKMSNRKKQVSHNSENRSNQSVSHEQKSSAWNKKQPPHSENRFRRGSSSSENSWKRDDGWRNYESRSKYAPVSDSMWSNSDEHFPMLGAEAPVPQVNVWEERKCKQEEILALQPQNKYDEDTMLQEALALSLMEATKEEQKRKLDEEYRLQMATLEHNPEILNDFKALDELTVADKSELESCNVLKPSDEQHPDKSFSRNAALSSIIQKGKTSSSGGARPKINKIIDSFGGWGLKDDKKQNSNVLCKIVNSTDEKSLRKTDNYNPSPGFQRNMTNNNAKKPENVVSQWQMSGTDIKKPVASNSWSTTFSNDDKKSSDPWENPDFYEEKETSSDVNSVKLSFSNSATDYCDISTKEKEDKCKKKSSGDVLDKWDVEDESVPVSDGWDVDEDHKPDKKLTGINAVDMERNSDSYQGSASSHNIVTKCENSKDSVSNFKTIISVKEKNSGNKASKGYDSLGDFTKTSRAKNTCTNGSSIKKQKELSDRNIFSQFENTYNYIVGDTGTSEDRPAHAKTLLNNDDIWSDKTSTKSTASNSVIHNQNLPETEFPSGESPFKFGTVEESNILSDIWSGKSNKSNSVTHNQNLPETELPGEEVPFKFGTVEESGILSNGDIWGGRASNKSNNLNLPETELPGGEAPFKFGTVEDSSILSAIANKEVDTPPILPPYLVPVVPEANESNQTFTTEMPGDECVEKSPPILPQQTPLDVPSQYLFPAMFPGINPMLFPGMDNLALRQMLMLTNPFFASQLFAMEQYYRALGMPVDLFSFPTQPVPNMPFPGLVNTLEQNIIPNTVGATSSFAHHSHLQNQFQDQSVHMLGNQNSVLAEKHLTAALDKDGAAANTIGSMENDPWYTNVLSNDSESVIPPPKPLTLNTDDHIPSTSVSQPPKTESASSFSYDNMNSKEYGNSKQSVHEDESPKSSAAVEACLTKSEVSGWGNLDDESFGKCKSKTNSWDTDYGWGADTLPAKSVKNPSMYEDKKVVHRQPARQPQLSRFQNNRRFK